MNMQTDPASLDKAAPVLPAQAEQAIRAVFLQEDRMNRLGAALAAGKVGGFEGLEAFDFRARVKENGQRITDIYRQTSAAQARGETITPAAQWLLDNHYVVEEANYQVKRDLPRRFFRELPAIEIAPGKSVPRALVLAWLYVAHTDSAVSAQSLRAIVEGFQEGEPLKIGELWALPSFLRFVLVENMRRIASRVSRARAMRHIANEVADRVLASPDGADRQALLSGYAAHARDTTFATQLLYRLRDGSQNAGQALVWLEGELEGSGSDAEEIIISEHHTLSSGNVTAGNIVRGLRLINDIDWTDWFESVSRVDALLRDRGDFADLDFPSRDIYRTEIEDLAKRSGLSEYEVARRAVDLAGDPLAAGDPAGGGGTDIGFFLVGDLRPELERAIGYKVGAALRFRRLMRRLDWVAVALPVLAITMLLLGMATAALTSAGLPLAVVVVLVALFAIPAGEAALSFYNTAMLQFLEPTRLIGFEYKEGVPREARTLVVVPSLIGSRDEVEDAVRNLEVHHLANMKGDLHFALLSDWVDSKTEQDERDLEILDYARREIAALNGRYPADADGTSRFHLLHRRRLYNPSQGCWMGWERKRGKLHELDLLLRGDADTTFLPTDTPLPKGVVHVMTLDADTRMTRDVVTRLVGKMMHPLNRPVVDIENRRVTAGYAIMQPRVTPSLSTGDDASFFQRVFSSNRGLDPYVFAVSDVYQDVFRQGTFTGKGLYHVDAMETALAGRIPENAVLSHDLLEGALARAALVTDVEVVEDYPTRYLVDASRQHRWARGDWQLLPMIFSRKLDIPPLSRWKMVDNLRRSLTPILWVLASIAGWAVLPFTLAAQWQALLILSQFVAPTYEIVNSLVPKNRDATARGQATAIGRDIAFGTALVALKTVLMAHSAWMMADAIVRTLYRLTISHRNLLEWRTASQAYRSSGDDPAAYYTAMHGSVLIALAGLLVPVAADSTGAFIAFAFVLFWIGAPAFAWLISRSAETEDRLRLLPETAARLRIVARRTWLYFERFVTAEDSFLPPDNYQESPHGVVAHRTSPTNIGVYLLSVVSARDFGWISLSNAVERIEQTMSTIERMERYRGHLYNWYDTKTLHPLSPLYVSSVDSGNLAGHLIAVAAACAEWAEAPPVHLQGDFEGILDAVTIMEESLTVVPDDRRPLRPLRQRLHDRLDGMRRAVRTIQSEPEMASIRTINLAVLAGDIRKLADSMHHEIRTVQSEQLADWAQRLVATAEAHVDDSHSAPDRLDGLRRRLLELRERTRKYAFEMDFAFLLRQERKLLSIGYRVDEHQLDESCYDLLASEARLTSLFAIAKGDIQTEHWFHLGRPIVEIGFHGALMSWSGSMFEYLMPPLVMKEPAGSILNQTSRLIVERQIQYGRQRKVPWGISEAAYNARDRELTYQYTNFGVPGLGLKRGLSLNTVIAPYATVLASQVKPAEAVANLDALTAIGALGRYGFYDAVDFTPQRVPEGDRCAVVYNYMAHHQGMSVVAVANVVFEGRMRDRFHSDPVIEAAELLLQEKAPREIPPSTVRTQAEERLKPEVEEVSSDTRIVLNPAHALRATNVISNGRYSMMVTATGAGYSRWQDLAVTRWHPDPSEDRLGTFLFLRDIETGAWWSTTAEPRRAEGETCYTHFADDRAQFVKTVDTLRSEVECIVIGEGHGEGRRLTLYNDGMTDRYLEVTSYAELVLGAEASDNAHPAFSKMFVETEIVGGGSAIHARRRKRDAGEADIAIAHFVTDLSGTAREMEAETDRRAFIGRGRTIADAAAFDAGASLSGAHGFVMDPIMALRRRVRVPANKKVVLTFWTVVGADRSEVEATMSRLDHPEGFQRQAMLGWTRSQVQTRHIGISLADAANVQKLARFLIYPDPSLRAPPGTIAEQLGSQSALWPMSISGDYPIFAVRISNVSDIDTVAQALRFQEYMRARGIVADLVVVNEQAASYVQDLQQAIESLCENSRLRGKELGPRQHIFAVRKDLMDQSSYDTLLATARVVVHTRNGTVFDQIERAEAAALQDRSVRVVAQDAPHAARPLPQRAALSGEGLEFWNGFGGFDSDGRDYVVRLAGTTTTPQPWINVISNAGFGFHTSAEGASFTWSRNSRDFQLTPWSNDPVRNRPGEGIYIHDLASGRAFAPTATHARDPSMSYEARHGQGVSTFSARRGPLSMELVQLVDEDDPVKIIRLVLRNGGSAPLRLRIYGYAEWVLGNSRSRSAPNIVPRFDAEARMLTAGNPYSLEFADRVAFLATDGDVQSATADRHSFIGSGSAEYPEAVLAGAALDGVIEAGRDPCSALATDVTLEPGSERTITWLLGDASSVDEARELVRRHQGVDFAQRLSRTRDTWRDFLETIQVDTPDRALNALVNHWLPYQALACRIRARSAFYQASGAYGFRDQLQDTLAFLLHDPSLARAQILNAAGRQFVEGDVQHWWLPRTGAGVRTLISDDVVWLAYGVARYVTVTGDATILDETVPFIRGPALAAGEHDAFFTPEIDEQKATIYEHAARALELAMSRKSAAGLPLILGGDWNDGMNRVGIEGRGESVWLAWFLLKALRDFEPIARSRGDTKRADAWRGHADMLRKAVETTAWDGKWYRRGSFDDGSPLGSTASLECQIDSIAQSWSVISGEADPGRARQAMTSALEMLADEELQIVRLFRPPFDQTDKDPGYIKSYPPGVRENGGQYTHAATWLVIALAEIGMVEEAWRCFAMLNPVNHALDADAAERYRVEPYVVAADVYSSPDKTGRGGWTWYTGSAGWLYRAAVEGILGIRKAGNRITVSPAVPAAWNGFSATLRIGATTCHVTVERARGEVAPALVVQGNEIAGDSFDLSDGEMHVTVRIAGDREVEATRRDASFSP